jgi:hypothetical protein
MGLDAKVEGSLQANIANTENVGLVGFNIEHGFEIIFIAGLAIDEDGIWTGDGTTRV